MSVSTFDTLFLHCFKSLHSVFIYLPHSIRTFLETVYIKPLVPFETIRFIFMLSHLAGVVVLHLPASGQLHLLVGEHVEEGHQVPIVLVAFEMVSIPTNLTDHMLQTRVGAEHTVGTLRERCSGTGRQKQVYVRGEGDVTKMEER